MKLNVINEILYFAFQFPSYRHKLSLQLIRCCSQYSVRAILQTIDINRHLSCFKCVEESGELELFGPATLQVPIEGEVPTIPEKTKLSANYPNPFNPDIYISFDIRAGETGILQIYDLRGRILENREFSAGSHNFHWQPEKQASGIYLYRLQTESYRETKKMLLLK